MKIKLLITAVLLVCISSAARGNLIDMSPGGFNPDNGLPPAYFELVQQTFLDEAAHGWFDLPEGRQYLDQWVSRYGTINGGTYFFTNLFGHDTPAASISWNMTGAPMGLWMSMIDVFGRSEDGTAWENIYLVPWNDRFLSLNEIVAVDGTTPIMGISFYGSNTIPDAGSTLPLLGCALLGLAALRRKLSC
jgi:VPDSG-CTERM motif